MSTAPDLSGEWHPFYRVVFGSPDVGNYELRKYAFVGSSLPYNNHRYRYEQFVQTVVNGFKGALLPVMFEVRPITGVAVPVSAETYNMYRTVFQHLPKEQLAVMPMNAIMAALREDLQTHDIVHTCKSGEDLLDTVAWGYLSLMRSLTLRDIIDGMTYEDHCTKMYTASHSGWRDIWWYLLEDTTFFNNNSVASDSVDKVNVNLQGRRLGNDDPLRRNYTHQLLLPTFYLPSLGVT